MDHKYQQIWTLYEFQHPEQTGQGAVFFGLSGPEVTAGVVHTPWSYKYLCKQCGRIFAEVRTLAKTTVWGARHSYCRKCGNGTIIPIYEHDWLKETAPLGVLLHDFMILSKDPVNHILRY